MGLQKYRFDLEVKESNGAILCYTKWMGGPSLAGIRNCETPFGRRTVYVRREADTFFSIPAACRFRKRTIYGYITHDDAEGYCFRAHAEELPYAD